MRYMIFLLAGKLRLAVMVVLVLLLSACISIDYTQHNVGLMAPQPHPKAIPIRICQLVVQVTDPEFNEKSHRYIDAELHAQLLKYLHYDGRLAITEQQNSKKINGTDEPCQWQQLHINFTQLSDIVHLDMALVSTWTTHIVTAGEVTLLSSSANETFVHKEAMSLDMGDEWQVDRLLSVNSVRNRTNFIDAVIARITSEGGAS
ncbi:hypothetical protein [Dasania marina]|uniref:hypothetical protein n=1 Tax=Dasania marina TaxID=471499 RepID=UPI0030D7A4C7|tara:strand:- start:75667 stop:76275 length:609 start_codon:yes stop_codon:yes gene_type:complete